MKAGYRQTKKMAEDVLSFLLAGENLTAGKENHHEQSAGSINHVSADHASDAGAEKNSQLLAD